VGIDGRRESVSSTADDKTYQDDRTYQVVLNHEEQYSIWDARREPPDGWRAEGFTGTKEACLAHIARVWTNLLPLSARGGDTAAAARPR
jgi:MbtH protein